MTYEYSCGGAWNGMVADGVFNHSILSEKYFDCCKVQMKNPKIAIADTMAHLRDQKRIKPHKVQAEETNNLKPCSKNSECIYKMPICETYILSVSKKGQLHTAPKKPYISTIVEELSDSELDRLIIMVLSNCKDVKECNEELLEEIGFIPWPKNGYHHYRKFSNAAKKLIENSIYFFEAPCCELFENLQEGGFTGVHDTH